MSSTGPKDERTAIIETLERLNGLVQRVCGKRKAPEHASLEAIIDPGKPLYKRFFKSIKPHVIGHYEKGCEEVHRTTDVMRREIERNQAALSSIVSAHKRRSDAIVKWYEEARGMVTSKVDELNSFVHIISHFVASLRAMCAEAPPTEAIIAGTEELLPTRRNTWDRPTRWRHR